MGASCTQGHSALLKQMDQRLQYCDLYIDMLMRCKDSTSVANVCSLLKSLLHLVSERGLEELKEAYANRLVRYLTASHQ
jgi:hypothetical protein